MHVVTRLFVSVVDNVVDKLLIESLIPGSPVRMNLGSCENVFANRAFQQSAFNEWNDESADLSLTLGSVALQDSHNRRFLSEPSTHLALNLGLALRIHA